MVSTANFLPMPVISLPNDSIKVDLPTPGTPVMPTRRLLPVWGRMISSTFSARATSEGNLLSISVMALESMMRSPARIAWAYSWGEKRFLGV